MRSLTSCAVFAAGVLIGVPASAENRTFVIQNNADGYGIDRCLANGEHCGNVVATAYCQSQAFERANSFRRIERDEITGAVPASTGACRGQCDSLVAIECAR